jgi:hypothetical protein
VNSLFSKRKQAVERRCCNWHHVDSLDPHASPGSCRRTAVCPREVRLSAILLQYEFWIHYPIFVRFASCRVQGIGWAWRQNELISACFPIFSIFSLLSYSERAFPPKSVCFLRICVEFLGASLSMACKPALGLVLWSIRYTTCRICRLLRFCGRPSPLFNALKRNADWVAEVCRVNISNGG